MGYLETKEQQARAMIGKRIEIPVHYDMWARGARFGVVHSLWWHDKNCAGIKVRLDHPQVKRLLRVARLDLDYCKLI